MRILRVVFIVLVFVLLAAHFSRAGNGLVAAVVLLLPLLLVVRKPWAGWCLRAVLVLGGIEWLRTLFRLVRERQAMGDDWGRLAAILGAVSLVTFLAAWSVRVAGARSGEEAPD